MNALGWHSTARPFFSGGALHGRGIALLTGVGLYRAVDLTSDPTKRQDPIDAVTKDNLAIGIRGQLRDRIHENNLHAYLFSVDSPLEHAMGYFISVRRERVANFENSRAQGQGADEEAAVSEIDPPQEVDRPLAGINSTRNQVAADLSAPPKRPPISK